MALSGSKSRAHSVYGYDVYVSRIYVYVLLTVLVYT